LATTSLLLLLLLCGDQQRRGERGVVNFGCEKLSGAPGKKMVATVCEFAKCVYVNSCIQSQ
jgi:hypothetical protein